MLVLLFGIHMNSVSNISSQFYAVHTVITNQTKENLMSISIWVGNANAIHIVSSFINSIRKIPFAPEKKENVKISKCHVCLHPC